MEVHSRWGTTRVGAFPIGIDFEAFRERMLAAPPRAPESYSERLILGADRLDYTKGIPERIRAVERLFEKHPEHRERVASLNVLAHTPKYEAWPAYRPQIGFDRLEIRFEGRA